MTTTASNFMLFQAVGSYGGNYIQSITADATCCSGGVLTNIQNVNTRNANLVAQYGPIPQTGTAISSYSLVMTGVSQPFSYHAIGDALTSP